MSRNADTNVLHQNI